MLNPSIFAQFFLLMQIRFGMFIYHMKIGSRMGFVDEHQ